MCYKRLVHGEGSYEGQCQYIVLCNELGDLGVGWNPNRPTTAIQVSKEHRHNPVMV